MIGNDVIDLRKASQESNWRRRGFLEKICSAAEQQLVLQAAEPTNLVWLLWTMKESAYKIINRSTGLYCFNPCQLQCTISKISAKQALGSIIYQNQVYFSQSAFSAEQVHSIAADTTDKLKLVQTLKLLNHKNYLQDFNQSQSQYELSKNTSGLPLLKNRTTGLWHDVSISHHGADLAIAYSGSPQSAG